MTKRISKVGSVRKEFRHDRLRMALEMKKISQYQIADEIGVDRSTISKLVNGHTKPYTATLRAISLYLEVSSDWLLGISNEWKIQ